MSDHDEHHSHQAWADKDPKTRDTGMPGAGDRCNLNAGITGVRASRAQPDPNKPWETTWGAKDATDPYVPEGVAHQARAEEHARAHGKEQEGPHASAGTRLMGKVEGAIGKIFHNQHLVQEGEEKSKGF